MNRKISCYRKPTPLFHSRITNPTGQITPSGLIVRKQCLQGINQPVALPSDVHDPARRQAGKHTIGSTALLSHLNFCFPAHCGKPTKELWQKIRNDTKPMQNILLDSFLKSIFGREKSGNTLALKYKTPLPFETLT